MFGLHLWIMITLFRTKISASLETTFFSLNLWTEFGIPYGRKGGWGCSWILFCIVVSQQSNRRKHLSYSWFFSSCILFNSFHHTFCLHFLQEDSVCVVLKGIAEVIRIMNVEIVSLEISVSPLPSFFVSWKSCILYINRLYLSKKLF